MSSDSGVRIIRRKRRFAEFDKPPDDLLWGTRVIGQPDKDDMTVVISQKAYSQIMRHSRSTLSSEVGGLLVGTVYKKADRYYVFIEAAVPDIWGEGLRASYKFTNKSWAKLIDTIEKEHPYKRIVGWFHSHPNFGTFYSNVDSDSHITYFNRPWMVGIVVDPFRNEGDFFYIPTERIRPIKMSGFYGKFERCGRNQRINWKNWKALTENIIEKPSPRQILGEQVNGVDSIDFDNTGLSNTNGYLLNDILTIINLFVLVVLIVFIAVIWNRLDKIDSQLDQAESEMRLQKNSVNELRSTQQAVQNDVHALHNHPIFNDWCINKSLRTGYTIQEEDTVDALAVMFSVSPDELLQCNNLKEQDLLPGVQIMVPATR